MSPESPSEIRAPSSSFQLGGLLVQNNLITQEQLAECLKLQFQIRSVGGQIHLGEIAILKGFVESAALEAVLAVQEERILLQERPVDLRARGLSREKDSTLGHIAVTNGFLTEAQVEEIAGIQERLKGLGIDRRFGEVCMDKGFLTVKTVEALLKVQASKDRKSEPLLQAVAFPLPKKGPGPLSETDRNFLHRLNDALLRQVIAKDGVLPEDQVNECLALQGRIKATGVHRSLAELLVEKQFLSVEDVHLLVQGGQYRESGSDRLAPTPAARTPVKTAERTGERFARPLGGDSRLQAAQQKTLAAMFLTAIVLVCLMVGGLIFWTKNRNTGASPDGSSRISGTPTLPPAPGAGRPAPAQRTVPVGLTTGPPTTPSAPLPGAGTPVRPTLDAAQQEALVASGVRDIILGAHGLLGEARLQCAGMAAGKAFVAENGAVNYTEFRNWFALWWKRAEDLVRRPAALDASLGSVPAWAEQSGRIQALVTGVRSYGACEFARLWAKSGSPLNAQYQPYADGDSAALLKEVAASLAEAADKAGVELPEEE